MKDHGFGWGYTWTKLHLLWASVVAKAPHKGAHRRKRERGPLPGMMLHQDGSRHEWLEGEAPLDLIVTMDDATGAIYSAFLVEEGGTASTFRALKEVFGIRDCQESCVRGHIGQKIPVLTVVDTFSRFSPATDPRFSYRAEDVVATLEQVPA
jgi:hypothetical protein